MANLILRSTKNTSLTNIELDSNFTALANDLDNTTKNSVPWVANTPVVVGDVLRHLNKFYLVTVDGITGSSGPSHLTGTVVNGTCSLEFTVPTAYTPVDVLNKIKTLDGVGSGLDSDFIRGFYPSITQPSLTDKTSIVVRSPSGTIVGNLIDSTINNTSIGLVTPASGNFSTLNALTLNVGGTVNMIGTLNLTTVNSTFGNFGATNINSASIELNANSSGNRTALLDFHGDDVYTDYSLRLGREAGGQNANSKLIHRGTGTLSVETTDGGILSLPNATLIRKQNSSGAGGELILQKSDTSSINGNLKIEIDNNSLKVSETESPFRGLQIDLTTCLANIGTEFVTNNTTQLLSNKTVPTLPNTINNTQIANTAYVKSVTNSTVDGNGVTTFESSVKVGGNVLDIGIGALGNSLASLNLHSSTNSDYDARIIKNSGVNGSLDIVNLGTGGIRTISNGQVYHGTVQVVRKLINSFSTVAQTITTADTMITTGTQNFDLVITPRLSNSWFKIYIRWFGESANAWEMVFNIQRNGVRINSSGGNPWNGISMARQTYGFGTDNASTPDIMDVVTIDTTGSVVGVPITYRLVASSATLGQNKSLWTNRCFAGIASNLETGTSEIIIEEIAQ